MNKEVETKIEVPKQEFYRLLEACQHIEYHTQRNVYYDCQKRLSLNDVTFRIRCQNDSLPKITLKIPLKHENGRRTALEFEETMPLNEEEPRFIYVNEDVPQSFKPYLHDLGISKLERLGAMCTQRVVASLPNNGITVELDHVILPDGKEFFEVEMEDDNLMYQSQALAEIEKITCNYTFSQISKYQRFLNATSVSRLSSFDPKTRL